MTTAALNSPAAPRTFATLAAALAAARRRVRDTAEKRRLARFAAGLEALSPHCLDDIGLGESFGIAEAEAPLPPPAMRA
jgi:uncharacterized protein YjiS (DUF1127 family)